MTPTTTSTTGILTNMTFDVTHSSALASLVVADWSFSTGRETAVHINYNSNPDVLYMYWFEGLEAIANLYLALMGEDSAGKFATYVRNNADKVAKHTDGQVEFLPPRKTLIKEAS